MQEFYYHVISDVPKRAGEHIMLDEAHPNRVHMRVYGQIGAVKDICSDPEKYRDTVSRITWTWRCGSWRLKK